MTMVATRVRMSKAEKQALRNETRRDPKTSPIIEIRKRVATVFQEIIASESSGKWKISDEAAYLRYTCDWNQEEINDLFLNIYEKTVGTIRENMTKDQYTVFRARCHYVYDATRLVFRLDPKEYDEARKSGKAFHRVYNEMFPPKKKKMDNIDKRGDVEIERDKLKSNVFMEEKRNRLESNIKLYEENKETANLRKAQNELKEFMERNPERLDLLDCQKKLADFEIEHPSPNKKNNKEDVKSEGGSWIAPDADKEWRKEGRRILKEDSGRNLATFVIECIDAHLLNEEWRSLADKLLKASK